MSKNPTARRRKRLEAMTNASQYVMQRSVADRH